MRIHQVYEHCKEIETAEIVLKSKVSARLALFFLLSSSKKNQPRQGLDVVMLTTKGFLSFYLFVRAGSTKPVLAGSTKPVLAGSTPLKADSSSS